ncbi:MAG: hypothetical protein ABR920_11455 [Terriglobales bacterium]
MDSYPKEFRRQRKNPTAVDRAIADDFAQGLTIHAIQAAIENYEPVPALSL